MLNSSVFTPADLDLLVVPPLKYHPVTSSTDLRNDCCNCDKFEPIEILKMLNATELILVFAFEPDVQ